MSHEDFNHYHLSTWSALLASTQTPSECERLRAENIKLRSAAARLLRTLSVCGDDKCDRPATQVWMGGKYRMCDQHVTHKDEYEDMCRAGPIRELTVLLQEPAPK